MKNRNLLLALACIVIFALGGVLYFKSWVVQKPFGIILFTGDGLTTSTLSAARIYDNGPDSKLFVESMPHIAILKTVAADFAIPDSAAAASLLATGQSVNNGSLSRTSNGQGIATLLELAAKAGRKTGLITNGNLADPAIAAFFAHTNDASDRNAVAGQLLTAGGLDVILGGGEKFFLPVDKGGLRNDGQDLVLEMRKKGYDTVRTTAELAAIPAWRSTHTFGVFSRDEMDYSRKVESAAAEPSLDQLVRSAIQILQYNPKGYVLVVDAGLIEKAARDNQGENVLAETIQLDRAIRVAHEYAGDRALILAVGKESPGGLRMNGFPLRRDQGAGVIGINARGIPSLTWSTGPNALPTPNPTTPLPSPTPHLDVLPSLTVPEPPLPTPEPEATPAPALSPAAKVEPATVFTPESLNVADDPLGFGLGPGSEKMTGYRSASEVFGILQSQF